MIVDGGDVQPAIQQPGHDRRDFGFQQHKVAHHHGRSVRGRECDPSSERQCRLDCDAVECDAKVGSRQSVTVNLAADGGGLAQRSVDLFPVDVGGAGRRR